MEDVTGFNQKNAANDGEKLIDEGLKKMKKKFSDHIIEIIRLMLKFDESERPSFIELAKLVLTSTENSIDSPKNKKSGNLAQNQGDTTKKVNKTFSSQNFKENNNVININQDSNTHTANAADTQKDKAQAEQSQQNLMTQSELFKSYSEQNKLYLNKSNQYFWFEFGGNKIGRLYLEGAEAEEFPKWRLVAKYKHEFPCHFT